MTSHSDRPERFTDEELAFLRHVRFGELPARVRPEDRGELTETSLPPDRPERFANPDEWSLWRGNAG